MARNLEIKPLNDFVLVITAQLELSLGIVLVGKILEDCSALPEDEIVVLVVNDAGDSAIGVKLTIHNKPKCFIRKRSQTDLEEVGAFYASSLATHHLKVLRLVRKTELLKDDDGLPSIWSGLKFTQACFRNRQ